MLNSQITQSLHNDTCEPYFEDLACLFLLCEVAKIKKMKEKYYQKCRKVNLYKLDVRMTIIFARRNKAICNINKSNNV